MAFKITRRLEKQCNIARTLCTKFTSPFAQNVSPARRRSLRFWPEKLQLMMLLYTHPSQIGCFFMRKKSNYATFNQKNYTDRCTYIELRHQNGIFQVQSHTPLQWGRIILSVLQERCRLSNNSCNILAFPKFLSVDSSDICTKTRRLSRWRLFWRTYQTVHHTPQQTV